MCCYLAHTHPTMFYTHLVLGLHTFQHSVGRSTNFTSEIYHHSHAPSPLPPPSPLLPYPLPLHFSPTPSLSTSPSSLQSHPLLTPFSPSFSPSPQHLSILILFAITDQFVRSAFNRTPYTHLITGDYRRDYWRLLEITEDYCTDNWRLL